MERTHKHSAQFRLRGFVQMMSVRRVRPALAQRTVYVSPDVPTDDPGGSGIVFLPWDVVAYNGGIYNPAPVLTFPMPTAVDAIHKMDKPGNWLFSGTWSNESQ